MNNKTILQKQRLPWLQRRTVKIAIALLDLIVILVIMSINVVKYEKHLATGNIVLLELAPVDPRGFMQGDYMALSYALENEVFAALSNDPNNYPTNEDGYLIIKVDEHNVGHFVRLADSNQSKTLATNEMPIYYRVRNGSLQLATNAFFFQEGHAEAFEAAKYGLFRVNDKGEPLLTDMVNAEFAVIEGTNLENKSRQGSGM